MRRFYVPEPGGERRRREAGQGRPGLAGAGRRGPGPTAVVHVHRGPQARRLSLRIHAAGRAGDKAAGRVESQAVAFNVDTAAEGDLRRASRDDIESAAPGALLHSPGSGLADLLKEKKSDLSESPWFYLLILLVLIAEQAMAVRLSYHLSGNEAAAAINLGTRTVS